MKNIVIVTDNPNEATFPVEAKYLVSLLKNYQYNPRTFDFVKNAEIISYTIEVLTDNISEIFVNCIDGIVVVLSGTSYPYYPMAKLLSLLNTSTVLPFMVISKFKFPELVGLPICNTTNDVVLYLGSVIKNSSPYIPKYKFGLYDLISEFENATLPLECWNERTENKLN